MPSKTGFWTKNESIGQHVFSFNLGRWIGELLDKNTTVIDLGCGYGTYLWLLKTMGFIDLMGVEGSDMEDLFEHENILIHDLSNELTLDKSGNVISLEIGEHIPSEYEGAILNNMARHVAKGHYLIMSWAIPGQCGHGHVNNRCNIWVLDQFQNRGLQFLPHETMQARAVIENHCSWFCNTIMIFKRP